MCISKKSHKQKKYQNLKNGQVMSVVTWQSHKIIKSTPFCREFFSDKENI
jgi:hypothetical protein